MNISDEKKGDDIFRVAPEKLSQSTATLTSVQSTTDDDQLETLCGLGSWTPRWLQRAANPKLFLFFYSLAGFAQGASFTYFVGCLSTLEKRFAYDTKKSGLLMISDELVPIFFGSLIGYFGGLANRPRLMTAGMVIGSLSSFIMAVPYFVYGPGRLEDQFQRSAARIAGVNAQFCDRDFNGLEENCGRSISTAVLSIFVMSNFLKGISSVVFYTIGTTYIDDSVEKKDTPLYLATLFALRLLGPTVGFLMSSFCLQYYEDLSYDPGYGPRDPRWVGAWWLGFVILGVFLFIFSIPMLFFPQRFPRKTQKDQVKPKRDRVLKSPIEQIKEMGIAMKRLAKNPILICHFLGTVLRLNGLFGYYILLPKYMEMQFRQSASKASLISGPASLIAMQIGIMTGGIYLRKCRPNPRKMTGNIVLFESVSILALITCMFITCPTDHFEGTSTLSNPLFDLQNECNAGCQCSTKVYTPVCGPNGVSTYFSPCFAGCTGYNKTGKNEVFTDCKCVHDGDGQWTAGDATKSYCGFECQAMTTFIIVLFIGKLVPSMARVPNALVTLRSVDPKDKSIALGTSSGVFSLLAFIPYPLIYGLLADSSCLVWEQSCGKTGNCWVYDVDKFRYLLHGFSAAFVFLGCVTDVFVWILSPRLRNLYDDDDDEKLKANRNEYGSTLNGGIQDVVKSSEANGRTQSNEKEMTSM